MKRMINRCKEFFLSTGSFLQERKCQGLPMYAIGIIIIGVILLALVIIFVIGISGEGTGVLDKVFNAQEGATEKATEAVTDFTGNFFK